MPRYTIDRFEGEGWAVLEGDDARTFSVPRIWLPAEVREGDVLDVGSQTMGGAHVLRIDVNAKASDERLADADRLRERLPRGPRGDFAL
jgi:hypothetical protein